MALLLGRQVYCTGSGAERKPGVKHTVQETEEEHTKIERGREAQGKLFGGWGSRILETSSNW